MLQDYNIEVLIHLIKERPVLWMTSLKEYHDKKQRMSAWMDICTELFPHVTGKKKIEKQKQALSPFRASSGEALMKKWKNLRDNFQRYLRRKQSDNTIRRYLYADHLSFLHSGDSPPHNDTSTKGSEDEEENPNENGLMLAYDDEMSFREEPSNLVVATLAYDGSGDEENTAESLDPVWRIHSSSPYLIDNIQDSTSRGRKRRKSFDESSSNDGVVRSNADDDVAFFESLLPVVRQFTMDEKLKFRLDVLNMAQSIRKSSQS